MKKLSQMIQRCQLMSGVQALRRLMIPHCTSLPTWEMLSSLVLLMDGVSGEANYLKLDLKKVAFPFS